MLVDGISLIEGSNITNLVVASGAAFPASPDAGELFYKTTSTVGLYVYTGSAWELAGSSLPSILAGGSYGGAASVPVLTVSNTGLVTAASSAAIQIDETQITDGTLLARLAGNEIISGTWTFNNAVLGAAPTLGLHLATKTYVDTTVGALGPTLSLGASQITSDTFADARISQSSVTQHQAALTILESQITDGSLLARLGGSETITGSWQFNNPVVVPTPSAGSHAASKDYVDQSIAGLSWKSSVRVATTANIALTGLQTIDGVALSAGNRVLVKNQSTQSENGVYVVATGAWTRATDFDSIAPVDEINSAAIFVQQGSTLADTAWTQTLNVATIGVDSIAFTQFAGTNTFFAGAGMALAGNTFNVNTASTARIVVNTDDIDLATVADAGTGSFLKFTRDSYGRVSGTTPVVTADVTSLVDGTYVNVTGDTMTGNLVLTGDGQLLRARAATTAGVPGLRIEGSDGQRWGELLHVGTATTAYGAPAGSVVLNTRTGSPLYFSVGDTDRMMINTAGYVGIGTGDPQIRFHVVTSDTARVATFETTAGTTAAIMLKNVGSVTPPQLLSINDDMAFQTNGFQRARISSSTGNFGIGISSAPYRLTVSNDGANGFEVDPVSGPSSGTLLQSYNRTSSLYTSLTTSGLDLAFQTGATPSTRMRISASGAVGIGTAPSATYLLKVGGDIECDTTARTIFCNNYGAVSSAAPLSFLSNSTFEWKNTSGTEHMRVTATGDLLIGTTTNNFGGRLVVQKAASASIDIYSVGATEAKIKFFNANNNSAIGNGSGGDLRFYANSSETERMRLDSNGNLIIGGTSAAARLDVQSTVAQQATGMFGRGISDGNFQLVIRNGNAGTTSGTRLFTIGQEYGANGIHAGLEFLRGAGATDGTMVLWSGNAERARISATGAVGIGTVSPAIRLTVVNTAGADGIFVRSSAFDMNLSGGSNGLLLGANYSNGVSYVVAGGSSTATSIVFATANSAAPAERMRVNAAGITVTGTVTETSTIRVKKNVRPIEGALEKVLGLQGVVYDMIDDSAHAQLGLIAEDVQQVLPNVVYRDEDGDVAGVQYARIVAVLIEAMKEQEARIKALEAIIAQG